jgi:short-subunit dehydrogenase
MGSDMSVFANEVIVITGAGSGLGREMARQLCAAGAAVGAIDRNGESLHALEKEFDGKRVGAALADVTDADAMLAAVRQLEAKLGPADRLIANAGVGCATPADDFSVRDFANIVNVNLLGVANSVAAVLPGMRERRRGHLVAISSLASFRGLPLMSAYCASKAGVSALFDSLAVELRPLNIAVTTICPGWVRTPLTDQIKLRMENILEPDVAVGRILKAVALRRRFVAFPWRLALTLRVMRYLPTKVADVLIANKFKEFATE